MCCGVNTDVVLTHGGIKCRIRHSDTDGKTLLKVPSIEKGISPKLTGLPFPGEGRLSVLVQVLADPLTDFIIYGNMRVCSGLQ